MGKFTMKSITGGENLEELKNMEDEVKEEKVQVGAGLLSDISKDTVKMELTHIPRNQILKNPDNKYSIQGIDQLKESIRAYGLINPINVKPKDADNRYMVLGGERRLTAIDELVADPDVPEWNQYTLIPCVIKDVRDINLKLSEKNKERYALITTNMNQRKYTDADVYMEIKEWKEIITELRENGVTAIPGYDNDGNEIEIAIKGEKTRDIIAKTTGMSRGTINRFEKVDKNASKEIKQSLMQGDVSLGVAEAATEKLDEEEQKALVTDATVNQAKVNVQDVDSYKREVGGDVLITDAKLKKDLKDVLRHLKLNQVYLNPNDKEKYDNILDRLKKVLMQE